MKISKYKNIFLDRDGIINEVVIRGEIISSPRSYSEFLIKKDFINFLEALNDNSASNYNFFIITNQPDISRDLLKIRDLERMHDRLRNLVRLEKIYYCPHSDEDFCECRKPKPGMLNMAINEYKLIRKECVFIGDSWKDIEAAMAANIDYLYLKTSYNSTIDDTSKEINSLLDLLI